MKVHYWHTILIANHFRLTYLYIVNVLTLLLCHCETHAAAWNVVCLFVAVQ